MTAENGQPWTPLGPQPYCRVLQPTPAVCPVSAMRAGVWARGGEHPHSYKQPATDPVLRQQKDGGCNPRCEATKQSRPAWGTARTPLRMRGPGLGGGNDKPQRTPRHSRPDPHASRTRTSLAADGGRYDSAPCIGAGHSGPANPAPSARDVWLLKVGGRDLGARRNFGEDVNFNGDSGP